MPDTEQQHEEQIGLSSLKSYDDGVSRDSSRWTILREEETHARSTLHRTIARSREGVITRAYRIAARAMRELFLFDAT